MENEINQLESLYRKIHVCQRCVNDPHCRIPYDNKKVKRRVASHSIPSQLMLIGQALGPNTQRFSGLPYTLPSLKLSNTGRNLEKFINLFGYTIDSLNRRGAHRYAYSSDILQCYPGKNKNGKGDIIPSSKEILNCISQNYLIEEIKLSKPNLILLMGKSSRNTFFNHLLKLNYPILLSEHIGNITETHKVPMLNGIGVIPIQHPSGANPSFRHMFTNEGLINLIKKATE